MTHFRVYTTIEFSQPYPVRSSMKVFLANELFTDLYQVITEDCIQLSTTFDCRYLWSYVYSFLDTNESVVRYHTIHICNNNSMKPPRYALLPIYYATVPPTGHRNGITGGGKAVQKILLIVVKSSCIQIIERVENCSYNGISHQLLQNVKHTYTSICYCWICADRHDNCSLSINRVPQPKSCLPLVICRVALTNRFNIPVPYEVHDEQCWLDRGARCGQSPSLLALCATTTVFPVIQIF